MATQQTKSRTSFVHETILLPPQDSITIGEINYKLIYITSSNSSSSSDETSIINNFMNKNGKIYRSIAIPIKYFNKYSSSMNINAEINNNNNKLMMSSLIPSFLIYSYKYILSLWNASSPLKNQLYSYKINQKYYPSITQQSRSNYDNNINNSMIHRNMDRSGDIIKFKYHPLYRKIIIAFKNGCVFFDCVKNCWLTNTLTHQLQTNITDFAFSHSGHCLAITCSNGIFLWELSHKTNNQFMFIGTLISSLTKNEYSHVIFSECDKYIAVYKQNGYTISIYNCYTNKLAYIHRQIYKIKNVNWIPSTKLNNFTPAQLAFTTTSSKIFILDIISFVTQTFTCRSSSEITNCSVSKRGNGLLVVADSRYLYYVSLQKFAEPKAIGDLYLCFNPSKDVQNIKHNELSFDDDDDEKKVQSTSSKKKFYVSSIKWSPCDKRVAVIYKYKLEDGEKIDDDNPKCIAHFVAIWAYDYTSSYRLGFITHPHQLYPLQITFRNHFKRGALLAICWNNGVISQHHLCFGVR